MCFTPSITILRRESDAEELSCDEENQHDVAETKAAEGTETEGLAYGVHQFRVLVAVLVFLVAENQPNDEAHAEDDTPSEQE
jgi:hypothetical protein